MKATSAIRRAVLWRAERIMRAFDRDNDGRLSDEERAAVREQLGDRFIELRERVSELRDDRGDDANREGARRRDGDGDRGRDARPNAQRERRQEGDPRPKPAALLATRHDPKRVAMQSRVATTIGRAKSA